MEKNRDTKIEEELFQATLKVITRSGLTGASLEAVASEAGIQSIELQNRYHSHSELVRAVVDQLLNRLDSTVPQPGGDLISGLTSLVTAYLEFWQSYPAVLAFYGEVAKESQVRDLILNKQAATRLKLGTYFASHREKGSFIEELDELNDKELELELVGVLLGPIFARANWQSVGTANRPFNIERHIRCFLKAYARPLE